MEEKKSILLHLYGEKDAEGDLRSLLKDEELQSEHQALSEVKFHLDHLGRSKPDATSIDRVVAHAARASASTEIGDRRGDRPPLWRTRPIRKVLIPAMSLAAVIVIAVWFGYFSSTTDEALPASAQIAADEMTAEAESLLRARPVVSGHAVVSTGRATDPLLVWNYAESLRELSRRIETMRPADDLDWGARSIPLETLPGGTQPGIHQASSRR
ncbi:MAG: hypothetical protein BMS9Abin05_0158 [Rhodothermia bacterium]|nr:MAG: hypothetical protein BMS9Abin05_0158 [Rhodothermia bacterium]